MNCCRGWRLWIGLVVLLLLAGTGWVLTRAPAPVSPERFAEIDRLFEVVRKNIETAGDLVEVAEIDHARMAAEVGSVMPPAHVLLFSSPNVERELGKHGLLPLIEMPLRILVFEDPESNQAKVLANPIEFLRSRHRIPEDPALDQAYALAMSSALKDIPQDSRFEFSNHDMAEPGLVTLDSPLDFETTSARIREAIDVQSDTIVFGLLDRFGATPKGPESEAAENDSQPAVAELPPVELILFGAPGPGGKAMQRAPSLGLDAFCQKILIWEDATGGVHVTFNDLLALARRQEVPIGLPLRVINRRIRSTFQEALSP